MKFSFREYKKLFLESIQVFRTAFFYIKIMKLENNKRELIVVTSRKIGNAVKRNYIRRITKSIFSESNLLDKYNFTYIVIYRQNKDKIDYETLKQLIHKFTIKLNSITFV